ncbi:MAG: DUF2877 domain-containing protein [Oliverpabstia sp.]
MTDIHILQLSEYAKQRVSSSQHGEIHSVYRKTINISTPEGLLALQAVASPLSPISLITDLSEKEMASLSLEPGIPVIFTDSSVDILSPDCRFSFSFENTEVFSLKPTAPIPKQNITELKENIHQVLFNAKSNGFDMIFNGVPDSELSLMFQVAKKRIRECRKLFFESNYESAALEISHLLGLGIGLTPSGDDFLCGVLASLHMTDQEGSLFALTLKKQISGHLHDTIDISAAFLACALENQYSAAVNSLYSNPDCASIEQSFSAIGHSSGIDTLCGIWFGLHLFS